jgi:DNA mismatch repair protein MSH4
MFNDRVGMDIVAQYALKEDLAKLKLSLAAKNFCLAALCAVFKHMQSKQKFALRDNTLNIQYQCCEGTMMMDCATARNLELASNALNRRSKESLYGFLNHTLTRMGARMLRTNILQPLTDVATLEMRLDAVEELTSDEHTFHNIRVALKPITDLDRIIFSLVYAQKSNDAKVAEENVMNVVLLKKALQCIKHLHSVMAGCRNRLLQMIAVACLYGGSECV